MPVTTHLTRIIATLPIFMWNSSSPTRESGQESHIGALRRRDRETYRKGRQPTLIALLGGAIYTTLISVM
jgi:hypothetical protein